MIGEVVSRRPVIRKCESALEELYERERHWHIVAATPQINQTVNLTNWHRR